MPPDNIAVAGDAEHQRQDKEKWIQIINELKLDATSNTEKEFLDLCSGTGRLIREIFIHMKYKCKFYTGVDYSTSNTLEFKQELQKQEYSWYKKNIRVVQQDVLLYDPKGKQFGIITASWCLGFFNKEN